MCFCYTMSQTGDLFPQLETVTSITLRRTSDTPNVSFDSSSIMCPAVMCSAFLKDRSGLLGEALFLFVPFRCSLGIGGMCQLMFHSLRADKSLANVPFRQISSRLGLCRPIATVYFNTGQRPVSHVSDVTHFKLIKIKIGCRSRLVDLIGCRTCLIALSGCRPCIFALIGPKSPFIALIDCRSCLVDLIGCRSRFVALAGCRLCVFASIGYVYVSLL